MAYKNLLRVVLFLLAVNFTMLAQDSKIKTPIPTLDKAPGIGSVGITFGTDTTGMPYPTQFNYNYVGTTQAGGSVGAMFLNNQFINNRWNSTALYHLTNTGPGGGPGTLVDSVAYVGAIRDMTTDGSYLYGGAAGASITKFDPTTGATVATITLPAGAAVRAIAYDYNRDGFWVGNWSDQIKLYSRTGVLMQTITGLASTDNRYGMGWDTADGTSYLYIWRQSVAGTTNVLSKLNIQTGLVVDSAVVTLPGASIGLAGGCEVIKNVITGTRTLICNYQNFAIVGYLLGSAAPPTGPGMPSAPSPASGTGGVNISGVTATWVNPAAATGVKVYYSADQTLVTNMDASVKVYDGAVTTTKALPAMIYNTNYYWRVIEVGPTGTTNGPVWQFTTKRDPSNWFEDFSGGLANWTVTNDGGTCVWTVGVASTFTLPPESTGNVGAANVDACGSGTTLLSTMTLTGVIDQSGWADAKLEFDQDWRVLGVADKAYVDVSVDNGTSWTTVVTQEGVSLRVNHVMQDVSSLAGAKNNVKLRFRSIQPAWDWWWAVDNIHLTGTIPIPVEMTSFSASTNGNAAVLNWATATETNNKGFEVERKSSSSSYAKVAFVSGKGTTTQTSSYTYTDNSLASGTYTYRLKQVDFDGTSKYSNEVMANITNPTQFSLDQNYPNPFNPTTNIKFSLATDSKVTLKIFNTIGEEVAVLLNGNMAAGAQSAIFDASKVNSGVYFYKLEATGIDGNKFSSVKKMILMK